MRRLPEETTHSIPVRPGNGEISYVSLLQENRIIYPIHVKQSSTLSLRKVFSLNYLFFHSQKVDPDFLTNYTQHFRPSLVKITNGRSSFKFFVMTIIVLIGHGNFHFECSIYRSYDFLKNDCYCNYYHSSIVHSTVYVFYLLHKKSIA